MDRGAWQTIVYGFTWSDTTERLTYIHTHTHTHTHAHTQFCIDRGKNKRNYSILSTVTWLQYQEQTVFTK